MWHCKRSSSVCVCVYVQPCLSLKQALEPKRLMRHRAMASSRMKDICTWKPRKTRRPREFATSPCASVTGSCGYLGAFLDCRNLFGPLSMGGNLRGWRCLRGHQLDALRSGGRRTPCQITHAETVAMRFLPSTTRISSQRSKLHLSQTSNGA